MLDGLSWGFPWALFVLALCAGGLVKGALGVGLPLVSTPLLGLGLPSYQAIALLAAPIMLSNLWQSIEGGHVRETLRRFGGLMVAQFFSTWVMVKLTLSLSPERLNDMLALALLLAVASMVWRPNFTIAREREPVIGVGVGLLSGLLGGVSSITGPVIITYLMALRLDREQFVRSVSVIYLAASLPLYGGLLWFGRMGGLDLMLSAIGMLPMALGLSVGRKIRHRLDERVFRRVLLTFLSGIAVVLFLK